MILRLSRIRRSSAVLALALLAMGEVSPLLAQDSTEQDSQVRTTWWNTPQCVNWAAVGITVITLGAAGDELFHADCIQDRHEESIAQQEGKAHNAWWKLALLGLSQIYMGVQFARDIYGDWKRAYDRIETAFRGFDWRKPERTLYRVAYASDFAVRRIDSFTESSLLYNVGNNVTRYDIVNVFVRKAFEASNQVSEHAAKVSDGVVNLEKRLGTVDEKIVGDDQPTVQETVAALPEETPPQIGDTKGVDWKNYYGQLATTNPAKSSSAGPAGPSRTSDAPTAGPGSMAMQCPLAEPAEEEPSVYREAQVALMGSQLSAASISAEQQMELEQLEAMSIAEAEHQNSLWERFLEWLYSRL